MVKKAARGADQHIGATFQLAVLVFEGNTADQEGDVQLVILAVFLEILRHLCRKLARRLEDQRARHSGACAALLKQGQHRQNE